MAAKMFVKENMAPIDAVSNHINLASTCQRNIDCSYSQENSEHNPNSISL